MSDEITYPPGYLAAAASANAQFEKELDAHRLACAEGIPEVNDEEPST